MSKLERHPATYTHDEEANAYYVYLDPFAAEHKPVRQRNVFAQVDEDAEGNVIGIEVED